MLAMPAPVRIAAMRRLKTCIPVVTSWHGANDSSFCSISAVNCSACALYSASAEDDSSPSGSGVPSDENTSLSCCLSQCTLSGCLLICTLSGCVTDTPSALRNGANHWLHATSPLKKKFNYIDFNGYKLDFKNNSK